MQFDGNFRRLGGLDPAPLQKLVREIPAAMWDEYKTRQQIYEVHAKTKTIPILLNDPVRHLEPFPTSLFREMVPALEPFVRLISMAYGYQGWISRCICTLLPVGAEISVHCDSGFSLERSHRVHIPILSSPGVEFRVGHEIMHMGEGELWEINNMRPHSVVNRGTADRVHLILDWAAPLTHADVVEYAQIIRAQRPDLRPNG